MARMGSRRDLPQARPGERVVAVVGATSGIGLAVAQDLARTGDRLLLVARDEARLREVAASLPTEVVVAAADVVDAGAVEAAVQVAVERWGRLDAVVTTAQPMVYGRVEDVPAAVMQRVVDVAVAGTHHLVRTVVPLFRRQGHGTLVVVSSLLAEVAVPELGGYSAAKFGQLGLVRALQGELRHERGLHVCVVLPGAVDTPIYDQAASYAGSAGSAPPPVVTPEVVAKACIGLLERPRRAVHVGPANLVIVLGFRCFPWLYDLIAARMVRAIALRGPDVPPGEGNVFEPRPPAEGLRGGWTAAGRRRRADGRVRWRRR